MNLLARILWFFLYAFSLLPFWLLHRISDVLYVLVYYFLGYRKKVVRQNLKSSFPEKSDQERLEIEKKFYRGFCDVLVETIKTISISKEELLKRNKLTTPGFMQNLNHPDVNIMGAAAHLGNWEWLCLVLAIDAPQQIYGIYKPLSNQFLNKTMKENRSRFGTVLLATKKLKLLIEEMDAKPFGVGVFSDQAPHYYPKAMVVNFLNQKSYASPGAGQMVALYGMKPVWGWIRRVGRSQYEWGLEELSFAVPSEGISKDDQEQIDYLSNQLGMTQEQTTKALMVTQDMYKKFEEKIKMAPQDWLWSHRRWKTR